MSKSPTASIGGSGQAARGKSGDMVGLRSGTKLGKYEVVGRLGLGGQAIVYKAYDPLLDRFVAIKQIGAHLAEDAKFMDRFRKEAQILARLGTDAIHVVQIYELIEDERGLFIVMEYVEGQTLDALIERQGGPLPVQLALEILWNVLVGLRAVHNKGVIHRDIKPANILVDVNKKCRITDFGVAARVGGKTSMTLGTTKYMAPELFGGDEVDGKVDIYSLGFIVFEMLVGKGKFEQIFHDVVRDERAESLRWMKWHTNREMMPPLLNNVNPQVPEVLAKIVAKMTAKDPAQRFASSDQVLEVLKRHFTQQGQRAWQAQKRAKSAAASAAAPPQRAPEPIPAEQGAAGGKGERRPEPIPQRAASGSPDTTRLPKRKMTRRARLTVLGVIIFLMVSVGAGMLTYRSWKQEQYNESAGIVYAFAKGLWDPQAVKNDTQFMPLYHLNRPAYQEAVLAWREGRLDDAYQGLLAVQGKFPLDPKRSWPRTDRQKQTEALEQLGLWQQQYPQDTGEKFISDLEASLGNEPKRNRKLINRLTEARLALEKLKVQFPGTLYADQYVPARNEWLDAMIALENRDWNLANKYYDDMQARRRRAEAGQGESLDRLEIIAFHKEFRAKKGFAETVAQALALAEEGLKTGEDRKFLDARDKLKEAMVVDKSANLDEEFAKVRQLEREARYRELMRRAEEARAQGDAEASRRLWNEAVKVKPTEDVKGLLAELDRRERYAELYKEAQTALNANDAAGAISALTKMSRLYPADTMTDQTKQALTATMDPDLLPETINKIKAAQAYAQAVRAKNNGQIREAIAHAERAMTYVPNYASAAAMLKEIEYKQNYDDVLRAADDTRNKRDWDAAVKLYRKAMQMTNDRSERDRIQDHIRDCEYNQAMELAQQSERDGQYDRAIGYYRRAQQRVARSDQNTRKMLDDRIAAVEQKKTFQGYMDAGNKFFSAGKYLEALKQFQIAQKVIDGPQVADRIKDANYARFFQEASISADQQLWDIAKAWVNRALEYRDTAEARALKAKIQSNLPNGGE